MAAAEPVDLTVADLHPALGDPALTSMNFLNEVSERCPSAVSLAAGRPYEEFFDLAAVHRHLETFHRHLIDAVNTAPIAQAVIGGRLLEHGGSLVPANTRERAAYARNVRHLVAGLARRFPDRPDRPCGGRCRPVGSSWW